MKLTLKQIEESSELFNKNKNISLWWEIENSIKNDWRKSAKILDILDTLVSINTQSPDDYLEDKLKDQLNELLYSFTHTDNYDKLIQEDELLAEEEKQYFSDKYSDDIALNNCNINKEENYV